jgi:small basic protein
MANLTPPRLQTRAPLVTDDSTQGAWRGLVWIDTVANKAYIAVSVAVGAAVWTVMGAATLVLASSKPYDSSFVLSEISNPVLVTSSNGVIGGP